MEFVDAMRGIARPLTLLIVVVATAGMIVARVEIPEPWWALVGSAVTYYFMRREREQEPKL